MVIHKVKDISLIPPGLKLTLDFKGGEKGEPSKIINKPTIIPTPFMTAEQRVIDGKIQYVEIPMDWGKLCKRV